jgi:hypothetical protein
MPGPKPGALPLGDTPLISQLTEYSTGQQVPVKNFLLTVLTQIDVQKQAL